MLDHESQWLLRSAFITGRFDPLTALAMTVMEITEFHLYRISDVSHFSALSFCLVFIALTLPLYSLPSEYQISSLNYSFMKGFLTLSRWQSLQQGGKKTQTKQQKPEKPNSEAAALQHPQTTAPNNQETRRLRYGGYSGPELDLPALPCPNLLLLPQTRTMLHPEHQPTAAIPRFPPDLHAEVNIKKGFRLI